MTPDISERLERSLREEFSNEASPSDGQIYCKIRQYSRQNNAVAERQWWAHLGSENKRRDLRRLLRHERYTAALDTLLEIPGLWEGVRGGMWKKMMDLGCEEVGYPSPNLGHADPRLATRKSFTIWNTSEPSGSTCFRMM